MSSRLQLHLRRISNRVFPSPGLAIYLVEVSTHVGFVSGDDVVLVIVNVSLVSAAFEVE